MPGPLAAAAVRARDSCPDDLRGLLEALCVEMRAIRSALDGSRTPLLTVEEVARLVGRHPYTIRSWIKAGRLRATRVAGTGPKGRLLIRCEELDRLVEAGLAGRTPDTALSI